MQEVISDLRNTHANAFRVNVQHDRLDVIDSNWFRFKVQKLVDGTVFFGNVVVTGDRDW